MVTNATTIEEQLASLTRAIEGLIKQVQEQDAQIARLINKADNVDASHIMGKHVEAHDEVEASKKQHYTEKDKSVKELQISSDGLIPVDQLKECIEGTIRSKIEGSSRPSLTYSKPYTPRIDSLKMLMGYQPPKFQQFDGKGNPKQYVVHFVETCNNLKSTTKDSGVPKNIIPYEKPQRKLTLKEMQATQYPFLDSNVSGIFDYLLEANLIDLLEMKRLEEAEWKDNPEYCKYHHLVRHVIQDYFVFKDKIMQLARQGKISLEEDFVATNAIPNRERTLRWQ
ncbi:UNVERIFIED_CONTAM: hypothetical protein Sradi_5095500 [Sesamum radiatum]|uniref:Ty3-gypsy retrotransposon protein n=1 Tax=Sesamum radiatum TaxID=300843 RepID=A0AAW2M126_SESRA